VTRAIRDLRDLRVYRRAMAASALAFRLAEAFPWQEDLGLKRQLLGSSRSVCANLAEAWRKRRYPAAFVAKLSDAAAEAEETCVHLEIAFRCGYITRRDFGRLDRAYVRILSELAVMARHPEWWTPGRTERSRRGQKPLKRWNPTRGAPAPQEREAGKESGANATNPRVAGSPSGGGEEAGNPGDGSGFRRSPHSGSRRGRAGIADEQGAPREPRSGPRDDDGRSADEPGFRREDLFPNGGRQAP
jgi:four helix bundle protein